MALQPGDRKRDSDGAVAGLVLRISPNGSRHWLFRYSWKNARLRIALEQFPAVGLAEARKLAMECSEWLERGVDPRRAARRHRRVSKKVTQTDTDVEQSGARAGQADSLTIGLLDKDDRSSIHFLAYEYVEHCVKPTLANAKEVIRILKKDVLSAWRDRDARTVKPREVIDLLDGIVGRGSPV